MRAAFAVTPNGATATQRCHRSVRTLRRCLPAAPACAIQPAVPPCRRDGASNAQKPRASARGEGTHTQRREGRGGCGSRGALRGSWDASESQAALPRRPPGAHAARADDCLARRRLRRKNCVPRTEEDPTPTYNSSTSSRYVLQLLNRYFATLADSRQTAPCTRKQLPQPLHWACVQHPLRSSTLA